MLRATETSARLRWLLRPFGRWLIHHAPWVEILRWLYAPWAYLVYVPFLGIWTTIICGTIAAVARLVGPRVVDKLVAIWARPLCWANFTSVEVKGKNRIVPGQSYVIMSNHQSLFDGLAFNGYMPVPIRWVMKASLRRVPFLGAASAAIGHIFIDRTNHEKAIASMKEARERISSGVSVIIFPEGTRSLDGELGPFKKGGFMVALDLDLPILPVSITGSHRVLPKGTRGLMPGHIVLTIHEPVDVSRYGLENRDRLMFDIRCAIARGLTDEERADE